MILAWSPLGRSVWHFKRPREGRATTLRRSTGPAGGAPGTNLIGSLGEDGTWERRAGSLGDVHGAGHSFMRRSAGLPTSHSSCEPAHP